MKIEVKPVVPVLNNIVITLSREEAYRVATSLVGKGYPWDKETIEFLREKLYSFYNRGE